MRLLLDTHLLVWAMGSPQRLPAGLAPMLEDPSHTPVFSVASLWGLVVKQALGRPDFTVQPAVLRRALLDGGWQELPIEAHHALAVAAQPPLHRDPFERLLVLAQASVEGLLLITADQKMAQYPVPVRLMPPPAEARSAAECLRRLPAPSSMDLLPLRLLDPFWQLACTAALTGNGFLALLAVLLINLAAVLDPEAEWLLGLAAWRALDWAGAAESRGASQGLQRIARFRQAVVRANSVAALQANLAAIKADLLGQLRVAEQQARAGGPWDLPPPPSARAASSRCVRNGGRRWKGCWRRA